MNKETLTLLSNYIKADILKKSSGSFQIHQTIPDSGEKMKAAERQIGIWRAGPAANAFRFCWQSGQHRRRSKRG